MNVALRPRKRLLATLAVLLEVGIACTSHPRPYSLPLGTLASGAPSGYLAIDSYHGILELKDSRDGHLVRVLLQDKGTSMSAARERDGSALVAVTKDCTTRVERIAQADSQIRLVRTIKEPIFGMVLSPDGIRIAYRTYPTCAKRGGPSRKTSGGGVVYLPNVLAVVNLRTGARVATATEQPGHPFEGIAWSPDGAEIAVGYEGDPPRVLLLDSSHPSFHGARALRARRGCSYFGPAWTRMGIIVIEGCSAEPLVSPDRLVRINNDGVVVQHWTLPACIDGIGMVIDSRFSNILIEMGIGYGATPPCGREYFLAQVARLVDGHMAFVTQTVVGGIGAIDDASPVDW